MPKLEHRRKKGVKKNNNGSLDKKEILEVIDLVEDNDSFIITVLNS